MAFPPVSVIVASIISVAVLLPIIRLLSSVWKVQSRPVAIPDSKSGATSAFLLILLSFATVFLWRVLTHTFQLDTCSHIFSVGSTCPSAVIDVVDVPWLLALQAPVLLAVFMVMRRTRQNPASVGLTRMEWRRMLALGGTVSAIFVVVSGLLAPSLGGGFAGFSARLGVGLLFFAIVGFGEEIVWRGFIQTRLTAYTGRLTGWIIASLLFAVVWHFPAEYYAQSGALLPAWQAP